MSLSRSPTTPTLPRTLPPAGLSDGAWSPRPPPPPSSTPPPRAEPVATKGGKGGAKGGKGAASAKGGKAAAAEGSDQAAQEKSPPSTLLVEVTKRVVF